MAISRFTDLPFKAHLLIGSVIRLVLIVYADYHDSVNEVSYTDVDYKVFTDAARYMVHGDSPYRRHTYRYSPIVAFLLIPNILVHKNFGKILFSLFDLLITIATKAVVKQNLTLKNPTSDVKLAIDRIAKYSSLCWLYNPLSIAISTRGNADSVPCFLIILSILFLQTDVVKGILKYVLSGVLLGTSIHLRLYPLAFSFPMYLSLGEYKINRRTKLIKAFKALIPNSSQILLTFSCIVTLVVLTCTMHHFYGYEFLFETYIYHLVRKDTKHNFSVLFYYLYLNKGIEGFDFVKTFAQIFECIILLMLSLTFGRAKESLCFGLFAQAVTMVTYNSVITSQYFVWFLSLLPLVVHDLNVKPGRAFVLATIWATAQGAWLFFAYLLEFKSKQVFIYIWVQGLAFFCANVFILSELIKSYIPGCGYKQICESLQKIKCN